MKLFEDDFKIHMVNPQLYFEIKKIKMISTQTLINDFFWFTSR
jgi:hypothetical protein